MSSAAQPQWDHVRSELLDRLARCDVRPATDERPMFFAAAAEEPEPYYGPTREARAAVSAILGLPDGAGQQDWQDELKREGKLELAVHALGDAAIDVEARSALALLLLDSVDRMANYGPVRTELLSRIRWHLRQHPQVQARMRYFWTHMDANGAVLEALG